MRSEKTFVFSSGKENGWRNYKWCFLPTVEIKNYNVVIMEKIFFNQQVKNDLRTYDSVQKIWTGKGEDYTTWCLLNYPYLK